MKKPRIKLKNRIRRNSQDFSNMLDEVKIDRIKNEVDRTFISDTRITQGILEDPDFQFIKKRLKTMPRKENLR